LFAKQLGYENHREFQLPGIDFSKDEFKDEFKDDDAVPNTGNYNCEMMAGVAEK